jgi:hypothetical protein
MGMHEGRARLGKTVKELQMRWHETRTHWNDSTAKGFEIQHLVNMDLDAKQAANAMDSMIQVLQQIKRDCE